MQPAIPCIYALVSPVSGRVRVIGQTTRPLQTRRTEHISHSLNDRYVAPQERLWIQALADENLRPIIMMLEEVTLDELDSKEIWWIAKGLELKWPLLNENKGGKGKSRIHKTETEQKILPIYKDEQKEKNEANLP